MKSDQKKPSPTYINGFKCAVLTVSDRCSRGENKDESGKIIIDMLNTINGQNIRYEIIPDEIELIKEKLLSYCDELKIDIPNAPSKLHYPSSNPSPAANPSKNFQTPVKCCIIA